MNEQIQLTAKFTLTPENLEEFQSLHPAFEVLTKENMLEGLTAPIHKGAIRYYKETDLLKYINKELILP